MRIGHIDGQHHDCDDDDHQELEEAEERSKMAEDQIEGMRRVRGSSVLVSIIMINMMMMVMVMMMMIMMMIMTMMINMMMTMNTFYVIHMHVIGQIKIVLNRHFKC